LRRRHVLAERRDRACLAGGEGQHGQSGTEGSALPRLLASAERLSDAAIRFGSFQVKTPISKASVAAPASPFNLIHVSSGSISWFVRIQH
jgi:hypothetical protein